MRGAIGSAKEWSAGFGEHEIRVVNRWLTGARLYVDGECRDTSDQAVAWNARIPRMTATIPGHKIEVFATTRWRVRVSIRVDGEHVGGDVL